MHMRVLPKEIETIWTLFTAPVIWAVHFLVCYVGAAVYCALAERLPFGFEVVRVGVGVATLVALSAIAFAAVLAYRQWGFGPEDPPPHDEPTEEDRLLFQGFSTLLLCGLSFVAVIYQALPALLIMDCRS
jgi:hypothetical protein